MITVDRGASLETFFVRGTQVKPDGTTIVTKLPKGTERIIG
jgi:hypothetical protein